MKTFSYTLQMIPFGSTQDYEKQEWCEVKDLNEAWDVARKAAWKLSVTARIKEVHEVRI